MDTLSRLLQELSEHSMPGLVCALPYQRRTRLRAKFVSAATIKELVSGIFNEKNTLHLLCEGGSDLLPHFVAEHPGFLLLEAKPWAKKLAKAVAVTMVVLRVVGTIAAAGAGLPMLPGAGIFERVQEWCKTVQDLDPAAAAEHLGQWQEQLAELGVAAVDDGAGDTLGSDKMPQRLAAHQQAGVEALLSAFYPDVRRALNVAELYRRIDRQSGCVSYQCRCHLPSGHPASVGTITFRLLAMTPKKLVAEGPDDAAAASASAAGEPEFFGRITLSQFGVKLDDDKNAVKELRVFFRFCHDDWKMRPAAGGRAAIPLASLGKSTVGFDLPDDLPLALSYVHVVIVTAKKEQQLLWAQARLPAAPGQYDLTATLHEPWAPGASAKGLAFPAELGGK
jgi:hypothetical protein